MGGALGDESARYAKTAADTNVAGSSVYLLASRISRGELILDIGCGSGEIGAALAAAKGAIVDGIEADPLRAEIARRALRFVQTGLVGDEFEADDELSPQYDTILLLDVLEHVVDPSPLLLWAIGRMRPEGRILALIPNSAHIEFRLKMLRGDWRYTDSGFFDRDHVRFYDPDTMSSIPQAVGLVEVGRWYRGKFWPWMRGRERLLQTFPRILASSVLLEWRRLPE